MGDSGGRKRSKKSKRSKRGKADKKNRATKSTRLPPPEFEQISPPPAEADNELSQSNQAVVIELQKTELSRLLREQQRLNERIDLLLQLHEREQVLRQQMQASLDKLTAQRSLPGRADDSANSEELVARVNRAEGRFAELQSAVGLLVTFLERRRGAPAH